MKRVLLPALLFSLSVFGQTNAPTVAELQRMKLELEVEKAKLEAERARFDTEKAKWEAQRAAAPVATIAPATSVVVFTNAPAEPLFLAREAVRLYRRGQIAGDLPAGSIVTTAAHPKQRDWLIVTWRGIAYEAEAKYFSDAASLLADLKQRAAAAKAQHLAAQKQTADLQSRRLQIEQQITLLDLQRRQTVVVVPPPVTSTNQQNQVLVFNNDTTGYQISRLRNEQRDTERDLDKIQKQLPALAQEHSRAEAALQRAQQQIDAAKSAR